MTVAEALADARATLASAGVNSIHLDAELLLCHVLGKDKDRAWLLAHSDDEISRDTLSAFQKLIDSRGLRTPVVHLTNRREFYGLDFFINQNVLTPRVETEKMVELAIQYSPEGGSLIDVGTGSGAIGVAIAKHRPDLEITATDVSFKALEVAKKNVTTHGAHISLVQTDLLEGIETSFDVVVCNLPYLADKADLMPEVQKEPEIALFGGEDGLDIYRRFLNQLPRHLNNNGYLFTECDPWQQHKLIAEAAKIGLKVIAEDYFVLGFQLSES